MSGKIFINYRRGDDPGNTGRLFDRLQDVFPPQQLFLDVDNIAPGLDFVGVLNERVGECDILLAVIGRTWVEARDAAGNRRLEDPDDFVRIEIESALNQDKRVIPVLVGDAPMPRPEDLPTALRPLARRNAVRLTHERFRADTQGLIKALQQALTEIEAQHEVEARAEAERRAEEERRLREADTTTRAAEERRVAVAEAAKRAEDETRTKLSETQARQRAAEAEARKKQLEAEARERAAEERRRLEAAAKHHADEERSFAAALRVNTLAAIDAFVITYPEGAHAAEAKVVKAALLVRDEAYRRAMTSDDHVALRAFCDAYKKGPDIAEVRARLRLLDPGRSLRLRNQALIGSGALAAAVIAAATIYWGGYRIAPPDRHTAAVPAGPSSLPPAPAVQQTAAGPAAPVEANAAPPQEPSAAVAAAPNPDQAAWSLITDTSDEAPIKRFIAEFPNSTLREDAEAKLAALETALAAKAAASLELVAWNLVKDSKEPQELRRFVDRFPSSAHRPEAEARIAALASVAPAPAANAPDPHELARSLQFELKRVGCFTGTVNGAFDGPTKAAWHQFTKLASVNLPDDASSDAVNAVRGFDKRVCPLVCQKGQHADGETCIANPPPHGRPSAQPSQQPQRGNAVVDARALPVGAIIAGGSTSCGPNGCIHVPKNCHAVKLGRGNPGWTGTGGHIVCP